MKKSIAFLLSIFFLISSTCSLTFADDFDNNQETTSEPDNQQYITADTDNIAVDESYDTTTSTLSEDITTDTATVQNFTYRNHSAIDTYDQQYRYPKEKITSAECSGNKNGYGGNHPIQNVYDDDYSTHWETTVSNNSTRQNYITFTFTEALDIGRIVYAERQDTNKGFPTKFDIYASNSDDGDFTLVAQGSGTKTQNAVEISFPHSDFKRLKFVWTELNSGDSGWASASEFRFYKPDLLKQQLENMFVSSDLTELNPNVDASVVSNLEAEVKVHPFKEDLWGYIEKAYSLLNISVQPLISKAETSQWELNGYTDEALQGYNNTYLVDPERTAIVTDTQNNMVTACYDGDRTNNWTAKSANNATTKNYLTFSFPEEQTIGRIIFSSKTDSNGFPTRYKIYTSDTDSGNDFTIYTQGSYTATKNRVEISFPEHSFKRLRFVWDEVNSGNPGASEFAFYRADNLINESKSLFTDGSCSALVNGITMATVKELASKLESYPLPEMVKPYIDAAAALLNNDTNSNIHAPIILAQRGNRSTEQSRTKTCMTLAQFDLTGYYARPGETLGVYVNADINGPMPRFVLATTGQDPWSWCFGYDGNVLHNGYNSIKVPDTMKGCQAIYFYNPAIPQQQAFAPVVRLVGGTEYPVYRYDSKNPDNSETAEAFLERLGKYCEEVTDIDAEAEAGNGKYNICELTSDKVIVSTSARGALVGLNQSRTWDKGQGQGQVFKGPKDTMMLYDMMYDDMMLYSGFNVTDPEKEDYKPYCQFLFRAYTNGAGLGWGQSVYAGFNTDKLSDDNRWDSGFYSSLATVGTVLDAGWAVFHEIGHVFDNGIIGTSESTNNLYGLMGQLKYQGSNRLDDAGENRWYNHFTNYINTGILPSNDLLFYPGAVIYQLDAMDFSDTTLYNDEGISNYGRGCRYARLHQSELSGLSYTDKLVISMSMGAGVDLSSHFEFYGRKISEEARWLLKGLPKNTKPTWFVNDRTFKGNSFDDTLHNTKPQISSVTTNETTGAITLDINNTTFVDENGSDKDLQCFAIYKREIIDGDETSEPQFVGITGDNKSTKNKNELYSFIDSNVMPGHTYEYSVSAYDCSLLETPKSDTYTVGIPDSAIVPVKVLRLNNGDEGYTSSLGFKYKLQAKYSPDNATVDLNTMKWQIKDNLTGNGVNSIRITDDPDFPNDPTRKIIIGVKTGSTRVYVSFGGITQTYRFVVNGGNVALQNITLDKDTLNVKQGDTAELTLTKEPDYTTNTTEATWSSEDESVATVENGIITAVGAGTTTITAQIGDKSAICTVNVAEAEIPVESIDITSWVDDTEQTPSLIVGDTKKLTATINPSNTTNINEVQWTVKAQSPTVEGTDVVTIDNTGNVKAQSAGTATIEASIGEITSTIDVVVSDRIPVKYVTLNYNNYTLRHAEDFVKLTLTANPLDATDAENITWTSSNKAVATVDEDGTVHPVTAGNATITGFCNGKYAKCNIIVDYEVEMTGVKFKGKTDNTNIAVTITEGKGYQLSLVPIPISATSVGNVEWNSDTPSVATVDPASGFVTAVSAGTAVITGSITQSINGSDPVTKSLTCTFTVNPNEIALTGVSISKANMSLKPNEKGTLSLSKRPTNANVGISNIVWSSDRPSVAEVDPVTGVVTAKSVGTAIITGTMGMQVATCSVTVQPEQLTQVNSLELEKSEYTMSTVGETLTIKANCDPESETPNIWWSSSDETVAKVDQNGTVTSLKTGKTVITATVDGKTATCDVIVPGIVNAKYQTETTDNGTTTDVLVTTIGDNEGAVLVTIYDENGKYIDTKTQPVSENMTFSFDKDFATIKIFWWENMNSIKPKYKALEINK